jgi:hypothetical protein
MTATGHSVIGVTIAALIPNPLIAIPLAVGSHILADAFPHWDVGTNRNKKTNKRFFWEAVFDLATSYIIVPVMIYFLFPQTDIFYAYLIVIAAQFLDWASAPYVFLKISKPPIFHWFYKFQKSFDNRLDKPWGIIGQVAVLTILVFLAVSVLSTTTTAVATP